MSGSTIVCKTRMYYSICKESPCISFYRDPLLEPGQIDNTERDYHGCTEREYAAYLSDVVPGLDEFVESLLLESNDRYCLARYFGAAPKLYEWDHDELVRSGVKECKCGINVKGIHLELTFSTMPTELVLSELGAAFEQFFQQYDSSRRGALDNDGAFEWP